MYSQKNSLEFYERCKVNDKYKCEEMLDERERLRLDVNVRSDNGCTPSFFASYHGNRKLLKQLVQLGADVNLSENGGGVTPFAVACVQGSVDAVDYLLGEAHDDGVRLDPNSLITGMVGACQYNHPQIVRRIVDRGSLNVNIELDQEGATPLYVATETANEDVVTVLLSLDADPNIKRGGYSCLMVATQFAKFGIMTRLLKAKAKVNDRAPDGATALLIAAQNGIIKAVDMLMQAGADPNLALTTDGSTALYVAAARHRENTVTALLEHSNVNVDAALSTDGNTTLHVLCQHGRLTVIEELFKKFPNAKSVDQANKSGATPLHIAARHGQAAICRILLEKGADHTKLCDGDTPLSIATRYGRSETIEFLKDYETNKNCLVLVNIISANEGDQYEDHAITKVTYGSIIKLLHSNSKYRLHSHKVSYGSGNGGSGQQSVTGFADGNDPNSLWVIKGAHGENQPQGKVVKKGDTIRLLHLNTKKNLHSHAAVSPLTKNNEVSCFGEEGQGDGGDNWRVETIDGSDIWMRGQPIRLYHLDTKFYLHANPNAKYQHPIPGQMEVCGIAKKDNDNKWQTEEGVYFEERDESDF
ncbi:hypothetical protein DFA_05885 [Cavenderia fasciculata]|uniref:MIR domain-containing protein n=1 Tax=Cavenderia fasciculata TaxID=261658 RepID=F4PN60_CACFS|nr:uncharacterized protein DFA_05885 [Cavenderia fasciculata]EGG23750.1 hypothetical protein DFA_05885 [Cavenderia fasciculata]|eukprot:XP_004361601.1 hypothetical protein DFA_05885 [Cavenderia fasciculata]